MDGVKTLLAISPKVDVKPERQISNFA